MGKWQFKAESKSKKLDSFDYQLEIAFYVIGFVLMIIGVILGKDTGGNGAAILILLVAAVLSAMGIKYRRDRQWRWRGVQGKDLFKAIGITALSIFMLPDILVNLFHGFTRSNGATEFAWQSSDRFNPLVVLTEAVRVFPEFVSNPEYSIYLVFFCLVAVSIIFQVLAAWKVVYLSQAEFLQDCCHPHLKQNQSVSHFHNRRSPDSFGAKFSAFFSCRPFIVRKQPNSVTVTFSKVTSYDLKANFGFILFMSLFFIGAIYGIATSIIWIPEYLNGTANSAEQTTLLLVSMVQIIPLIFVAWFIWNPWLKAIFIRTVIEFNSEQIIVWEKAFGSQRQVLSIPQKDLLTLEEKRVNTQVPQVRNTSLRIRYRRQNIELAGHLLPQAMDTVQDIYDRYRHNKFSQFYHQTQELYLE
ncbi:MAG: hypothetical protein AAFQ41_15785 [Cyanobacteria bacterium J06623_7]